MLNSLLWLGTDAIINKHQIKAGYATTRYLCCEKNLYPGIHVRLAMPLFTLNYKEKQKLTWRQTNLLDGQKQISQQIPNYTKHLQQLRGDT